MRTIFVLMLLGACLMMQPKSFWIAIRAMYGIGCPNADKK